MTSSVYIDTSVLSCLTPKPTWDLVTAARQIETIEWWTVQSPHFELFRPDVAIDEAGQGSKDAASRCIEALREMTVLTLTDDAADLTRALMSGGAVPEGAEDAVRHIAVATVHDIDYILTWNFSHIANTVCMPIISEICEQQGFSSPIITTPNQLNEVVLTLEDEVMKELHQIRSQIASEHDNDHQKLNAFFEGLRTPGFTYGVPGRTFQTEEELDRHIEESNRDFELRRAKKTTPDSTYSHKQG